MWQLITNTISRVAPFAGGAANPIANNAAELERLKLDADQLAEAIAEYDQNVIEGGGHLSSVRKPGTDVDASQPQIRDDECFKAKGTVRGKAHVYLYCY